MNIIDCEQRSDEWFQARLGKITGTGFSKVLAGGTGKTRKDYMLKLIAERLTQEHQESYLNTAMQWGIDHEDEAIAAYEQANMCAVEQVGFVEQDNWIGVSPDGLVGDDGLVEIKCPNSTTHITNILSNSMPAAYKAQVQGQIWVTGRKWCDFVSFDPRMESRPICVIRVERDQDYIDRLEAACKRFVGELTETMDKVTGCEF